MKFSYKFLLATLFTISFIIFANIFALKYYAGKYFNEYVVTIKAPNSYLDVWVLSKLLENDSLDPELIKEYQDITRDLSSITNSLERFSKNPKPLNNWLLESLQKSWLPSSQIEQIIWTNALQSFFSNITNLLSIDLKTAEWKFIMKTIKSMAYFNMLLILLVLFLFYIWVVNSFRPIQEIILNLSNIIYNKTYKNIIYKKKDEFKPLIETINNLNKSLSLQEKIRSDFLSDLSHEIKTPITAVKCYLEWIEDWVILPDEKNMSLLYSEIERLIKITNSIMEFEKEESKKFSDIFIEKLNLSSLVEFVASEYMPIAKRNSQEIISYVFSNYKISMDKDKLIQILHNIFSNYIKYAWKNTTLSIKANLKNNYHEIIFLDNWKWVNKEDIPFLKEKFYKTEKSRNKSMDNGIGIWLSVIDKIVKIHNWEFSINSDYKKGFELIIKIPK